MLEAKGVKSDTLEENGTISWQKYLNAYVWEEKIAAIQESMKTLKAV